jgi:hypothetical protein
MQARKYQKIAAILPQREHHTIAPRTLQENTRDPPKLHFYYPQNVATNTCSKITKKKWERARKREEKFGQHGVALRIDAKMRRGAFILRERSKRDPPCMLSKWHSCKREAHSKGGRGGGHHERGELPLEEETKNEGRHPLS